MTGHSQEAAPTYAAPPQQDMQVPNLTALRGVVVHQVTQVVDMIMSALDIPYDAQNQYLVKPLPEGVKVAHEHNDPAAWHPSKHDIAALPQLMHIQEESSCCERVCLASLGCLNLRSMKLHFFVPGGKAYTIERPCKLGAWCCCPLEMTLYESPTQTMLGKVEEWGTCYSCCPGCCYVCCCCTCEQKVLVGSARQSLVHKYTLRNSCCCCGRVNNCCGATCCKPNYILDILDKDGKLVAVIQKVYAGGEGCEACCRMNFQFDDYVLEFPANATAQERALLVAAVLSADYAWFERSGDENNNN